MVVGESGKFQLYIQYIEYQFFDSQSKLILMSDIKREMGFLFILYQK